MPDSRDHTAGNRPQALPNSREPVPAGAERAEGLDPRTVEMVSGAIYWIKVAIANIRLYPPGSSQALKATTAAFAPISHLLEERETFSLGQKDGRLLVNGALYKHKDDAEAASLARFGKTLSDSAISSITFARGITVAELNVFLDGMSRKRWSQTNIREVTRQLREEGVTHVALNEQVYVALGTADLLIEKGEALLSESNGVLNQVMKTLSEVMEMVGDVSNQAVRDQVKLQIAAKLIESDPTLLPKLLERTAPSGAKAPEEEAASPAGMAGYAEEEMREIVGEMARLYHLLREMKGSGLAMEQVRKVVNKMLSLCRQDSASMTLYKKLLETDAADLLPAWLHKGTEAARSQVVAAAEELMMKDALYLLREDLPTDLRALVRALDVEQRCDLVSFLVKHLCAGLESPQADIRMKVYRRMADLQPALESIREREILSDMDGTVVGAMDAETDARAYREAAGLLPGILDRAVLARDFARAARLIGMLRKHSLDPIGGFAKRNQEAQNAIAGLAYGEAMKSVLEEFLSDRKEFVQDARDILVKLGAVGVPAILDEVRKAKDRATRLALADVIKAVGADAAALYAMETQGQESPQALRRLLDIAPNIGCEAQVLEMFRSLLQNPDVGVRLEAVRVLGRLKDGRADALVCAALQDANAHVVIEAMALAEQTGGEPAMKILLEILRDARGTGQDGNMGTREAACRVLGVIGDERIVPDLLEISKKRGLLDRFRRSQPSSLRAEAAKALSRFRRDPEVAKALQSLAEDDDAGVRAAAQWAWGQSL